MWLRRLLLLLILWGCQLSIGNRFTTPYARATGSLFPHGPYVNPALPPLPRGCGGAGTPIDYIDPVCCVSGYVYYAGQPVAGASVTVHANGQRQTAQTQVDPANAHPYYSVSLHGDPLHIKPGDPVTVTAAFGGQAMTTHFVAQAGGQQIDVIIPTRKTDSAWQAGAPGARRAHALTYDGARQQVVLFGGATERDPALADTWLWDGVRWVEQNPATTPPARRGHALAYDSVRQQVVLFGGQGKNSTVLQDMWVWDGKNWQQTILESAPPARMEHKLAFDPLRQRLVLFSGDNGSTMLNDTWEWDGSQWIEIQPTNRPTARLKHALVFDEISQRILLYGGETVSASPAQTLTDLWTWDGSNWLPLTPSTLPPPLTGIELAYDAARQQVVLFGNPEGNNAGPATWAWSGSDWSLRTPALSPALRQSTSLAYDALHQRIVLFGGFTPDNPFDADLADTWTWDSAHWHEQAPVIPFGRWQGVGVAFENADRYLFFGGLQGNPLSGVAQSATFRWQSGQWTQLTPATTPPARYGHRLARNQAGDRLLLFGGLAEASFYLNDTWFWQGNDWRKLTPAHQPDPRAYYGLTYDHNRGVWLLFGGDRDDVLFNDLWEFNGIDWVERITSVQPPARRLATLTYDPIRKRTVLFGGRNQSSFLDDLWEWDGQAWQAVAPPVSPAARASHGATYDADRQVVVIAGGVGATGALTDTWSWNGRRWQLHTSAPALPPMYSLTLDYAPDARQSVAFGERVGGNLAGEGIWIHSVFTSVSDAPPLATIHYSNLRDGRQGLDTFRFTGRGADGDATDHISRSRWSSNGITLNMGLTLTLPASNLPLGEQTLMFEVHDDEDNWSAPVTQTVFVRTPITGSLGALHPTWTLLLYVVADNNLAPRLGDNPLTLGLLYRLRTAGAHSGVQVGVLYDGPGPDDTHRYTLTEEGAWLVARLAEVDMGKMETLRDFVKWGLQTLPSDYVMLSLVDHANGIVGFGIDQHGGEPGKSSFLTPSEIRTALVAATEQSAAKIDILFLDSPSFGLLEDANMVDGLVNFMLVSPDTNTGIYPYERYRRLTADVMNPRDFALALAQHYAESAAVQGLPYIISVFDLAHLPPLQTAVGALGDSLYTHLTTDPITRGKALHDLRQTVRKYNSGGTIASKADDADLYVDLFDLANRLATTTTLTDTVVQHNAGRVRQEIQNFVIYQKNALGEEQRADQIVHVELTTLGGVAIFYPPDARAPAGSANALYLQNRLFPITTNWGWKNFIFFDPPGLDFPEDPPPLAADLLIEPLAAVPPRLIYLPLVAR